MNLFRTKFLIVNGDAKILHLYLRKKGHHRSSLLNLLWRCTTIFCQKLYIYRLFQYNSLMCIFLLPPFFFPLSKPRTLPFRMGEDLCSMNDHFYRVRGKPKFNNIRPNQFTMYVSTPPPVVRKQLRETPGAECGQRQFHELTSKDIDCIPFLVRTRESS